MPLKIKFTYKGKEYQFRRPELGNVNDLAFQRVNRRSRGGDLILFRDKDWPKTESLNLTFDFLTEKELQDFQGLLRISMADILQYTDHENRTWEGLIQNPESEGIQTGLNSFRITIVFEGDQV